MDSDIEFGDVEHVSPQDHLRPDRNRHFAVAPVFAPREEDLAIFVDLDAMREMEEHALSDTGVELGGVLLGGQFKDEAGRPFVVISDCLRAQHYESTKGSFKFTHETWAQITRDRDDFPAELQMVGWYHTHPDWGVFLSGMDVFICDHFFNRPLDVALVIDPCQGDRGFFQWNGPNGGPLDRTNGFYLTASRFRAAELHEYATLLEGKNTMALDPRHSSQSAAYPPSVFHVSTPASPWQGLAVLGMLSLQFCFLMVVAWRLLSPLAATQGSQSEIQSVKESIDRLAAIRQQQAAVDAKLEVLEQIVRQGNQAPAGVLQSLSDRTAEVTELRDSIRAQQSLHRDLDGKIAQLEASLADAKRRDLRNQSETAQLESKVSEMTERLDESKEKLAAYEKKTEAGSNSSWWSMFKTNSRPIGLGAVLGVMVVSAVLVGMNRWKVVQSEANGRETDGPHRNQATSP